MRGTTTTARGPVPRARNTRSRRPSGRRDSQKPWTGPRGPLTGINALAAGLPFIAGRHLSAADELVGSSDEAASSAVQAMRLRFQLAAREIAGGHAFTKHVVERGEFPGIRTPDEFADVIEHAMSNASEVRNLSNGRTAFWSDGVVVIRNPSAADGGSAFAPVDGYDYFVNDLN